MVISSGHSGGSHERLQRKDHGTIGLAFGSGNYHSLSSSLLLLFIVSARVWVWVWVVRVRSNCSYRCRLQLQSTDAAVQCSACSCHNCHLPAGKVPRLTHFPCTPTSNYWQAPCKRTFKWAPHQILTTDWKAQLCLCLSSEPSAPPSQKRRACQLSPPPALPATTSSIRCRHIHLTRETHLNTCQLDQSMDNDVQPSGSKRRRATLTKNPPPTAYPANLINVLRKPQSQTTLQRAPSAPTYPRGSPISQPSRDSHHRTQSGAFPSSTSSLENISGGPSPVIPFADYSSPYRTPQTLPTTPQASDDPKALIGAPFDASGLLLTFQNSGSSGSAQHANEDPLISPSTQPHPESDSRYHPLRNSQTIGTGGLAMTEVTPPKPENGVLSPKRMSGDGQVSKPSGPLRKKSGFSSFVNNMLGSPRTIKISAPENPMHMIHVGYDNQTGQFTVSAHTPRLAPSIDSTLIHFSRDSRRIGRGFWPTAASPRTNKNKTHK